jgi:hypothetical protein
MLGKLAAFFAHKSAVVVLGASLIVGGTAVAFAASGQGPLGFSARHGATTRDATETPGEHGNQGNGDAHATEAEGVIQGVDAAHSAFLLKRADSSTEPVTIGPETEFEGTLHTFADLKVGLRVHVKGTPHSDGSLTASSVEGELGDQNDDGQAHENEQELTGTITNVDTAHSRFIFTAADGVARTVVVSSQTAFDAGFGGIAGLRAGMRVEVHGTRQADDSIAATRVHREDDDSHSGNDQSGSDGSRSGSGQSGPSSGQSGNG